MSAVWCDCEVQFINNVYCVCGHLVSALPSVAVERYRESLCADLEAATKLTEGLSDVEMKAFLDTIVSHCSDGQVLTSGVGERMHLLKSLEAHYQLQIMRLAIVSVFTTTT